MRKRLKIMKNSAKKSRRLLAVSLVLVATAIIAAGAATVVSRQSAGKSSAQRSASPVANAKNNVTVSVVSAQDAHLDGQTAQMKQLTPEEAKKMAEGLKQMINNSTEGLKVEQHPDGSVSVDLQDRFQNVTVARVNEDGSVSTSCVDNAEAAGAFFGIDPRMIDENAKAGKNIKPLSVTQATSEEK